MRLAFADAYAYVSDPRSMSIPPSNLLDRNYLASRAAMIDHIKRVVMGLVTPIQVVRSIYALQMSWA